MSLKSNTVRCNEDEVFHKIIWNNVQEIFSGKMQSAAYVYKGIFGVSGKIRLCVYVYAHMDYICITKYWETNQNGFLWR